MMEGSFNPINNVNMKEFESFVHGPHYYAFLNSITPLSMLPSDQ